MPSAGICPNKTSKLKLREKFAQLAIGKEGILKASISLLADYKSLSQTGKTPSLPSFLPKKSATIVQ